MDAHSPLARNKRIVDLHLSGILEKQGPAKAAQRLQTLDLKDHVRCMRAVKDTVWVASRDGAVYVYDVASGDLKFLVFQESVRSMTSASRKDLTGGDKKFFANCILKLKRDDDVFLGSSDGMILQYRRMGNTWALVSRAKIHSAGVTCGESSGSNFWTAGQDSRIIENGQSKVFAGSNIWIRCLAYDRELRQLWSATRDGIQIWKVPFASAQQDLESRRGSGSGPDVTSNALKYQFSSEAQAGETTCMLMTASYVWAGCSDGSITVWDRKSKSEVTRLKGQSSAPITCILQPIPGTIWSGASNQISIWHASMLHYQGSFSVPKGSITCMERSGPRVWVGCRGPGCCHFYKIHSNPHSPRLAFKHRSAGNSPRHGGSKRGSKVANPSHHRTDNLGRHERSMSVPAHKKIEAQVQSRRGVSPGASRLGEGDPYMGQSNIRFFDVDDDARSWPHHNSIIEESQGNHGGGSRGSRGGGSRGGGSRGGSSEGSHHKQSLSSSVGELSYSMPRNDRQLSQASESSNNRPTSRGTGTSRCKGCRRREKKLHDIDRKYNKMVNELTGVRKERDLARADVAKMKKKVVAAEEMAEKLRVALAEEEKKSGLEGQIRRYIIRLQEDGGKKLAVHLAWGMFGSVSILGGLVLSIRVQGPSGDDLIYAPVDSNESSSKSASLGTRISLAVVGLAINFTMSSTVKRHTKETIGRLMAASSALFALGFCSGYAALPK